jgi:hypothetical protein
MKKTTKNAETRPIHISPSQIASRAYERFLKRGGEHGHDLEDWLSAERELLAEARGKTDASPARIAS